VAVVNRTGAGGAVGYTHVRGQSPDGHSLVWNSNSVSTAYHAGNMKFDYTAFAGVAMLTSEPVCYDPAPLVLGLVLGPLLERSLLQALTIARGEVSGLWASPQAALMLAAALVALVTPAVLALARRRAAHP
jgi:TctA family transporter